MVKHLHVKLRIWVWVTADGSIFQPKKEKHTKGFWDDNILLLDSAMRLSLSGTKRFATPIPRRKRRKGYGKLLGIYIYIKRQPLQHSAVQFCSTTCSWVRVMGSLVSFLILFLSEEKFVKFTYKCNGGINKSVFSPWFEYDPIPAGILREASSCYLIGLVWIVLMDFLHSLCCLYE